MYFSNVCILGEVHVLKSVFRVYYFCNQKVDCSYRFFFLRAKSVQILPELLKR